MPGLGAIIGSPWVATDCLYEIPDPRRATVTQWLFGVVEGTPVEPSTLDDTALLTEEDASFIGGQAVRGTLAATTRALQDNPEDAGILAERDAAYLALQDARERYNAASAEVNVRPTVARDTDEKRHAELERLNGLCQ